MTYKKTRSYITLFLASLLLFISSYASALDISSSQRSQLPEDTPKSALASLLSTKFKTSQFSLQQSLVPQDKPKVAVIEVNADNQLAKQHADDLLLSMQNELLLNGMDIVIGKENATDNNTLVMNINFSIQGGLVSMVRRKEPFYYFVENISRVTYNTTFSTISMEEPFLEISLNLDTHILGLTESSYDSIESIDSLLGRSANLLANLVLATFSNKTDTTGTWQDILNSTVIEVTTDLDNGKYTGLIKTASKTQNIGFSPGEKTYRFSSSSDTSNPITGELKVRYTNGREPEWLPAKFVFFGNIMIVSPTSGGTPFGMSFYIKRS